MLYGYRKRSPPQRRPLPRQLQMISLRELYSPNSHIAPSRCNGRVKTGLLRIGECSVLAVVVQGKLIFLWRRAYGDRSKTCSGPGPSVGSEQPAHPWAGLLLDRIWSQPWSRAAVCANPVIAAIIEPHGLEKPTGYPTCGTRDSRPRNAGCMPGTGRV